MIFPDATEVYEMGGHYSEAGVDTFQLISH